MNVDDALHGVRRLYFDTPPVIYFVERHPRYVDVMREVFARVRDGIPFAVTSPVTLAECLIAPLRWGQAQLQQDFIDIVVHGNNTVFVAIDEALGRRAAEVRAKYNLSLPDAIQVAVALHTGCEAILTNDVDLRRVAELHVVLVDKLEL